jgi:hypothetical protein
LRTEPYRTKISTSVEMPHITIRTTYDGSEDVLSEYLCDWPDCPNVAVQFLGVIRELRLRAAVCAEHAELLESRANNNYR